MASEVRDKVLDLVKLLKRERNGTCTHIVTWGYTLKSQLGLAGDFAYCYDDQVDGVLTILASYPEVDGAVVSSVKLEKTMFKGEIEIV